MLGELYLLELFHELTEVNSHAWVWRGGGGVLGDGASGNGWSGVQGMSWGIGRIWREEGKV